MPVVDEFGELFHVLGTEEAGLVDDQVVAATDRPPTPSGPAARMSVCEPTSIAVRDSPTRVVIVGPPERS